MKTKTCGECYFYHPIFKHEGVCIVTSELCKTCDFTRECALGGVYPKPPPTLFQRITQSPEVLAEEFVEMMPDPQFGDYRPFSMLTYTFYETRVEAIAATVAKLKETSDV